jgi:hypothetical protein
MLVCHESPQENIACHKSFHEKNSLREMMQKGPTLKKRMSFRSEQTTDITQPNSLSSQEGSRVTDPCFAVHHKLRLAEFWLGKKSN